MSLDPCTKAPAGGAPCTRQAHGYADSTSQRPGARWLETRTPSRSANGHPAEVQRANTLAMRAGGLDLAHASVRGLVPDHGDWARGPEGGDELRKAWWEPNRFRHGTATGFMDLFKILLTPPRVTEREPLTPGPLDERNLRCMRDALVWADVDGADPGSLAWISKQAKLQHPGTPGSWHKRLRRLVLFGWVKHKKNGTWEITNAGLQAVQEMMA